MAPEARWDGAISPETEALPSCVFHFFLTNAAQRRFLLAQRCALGLPGENQNL
jgi:hypothetical protein